MRRHSLFFSLWVATGGWLLLSLASAPSAGWGVDSAL